MAMFRIVDGSGKELGEFPDTCVLDTGPGRIAVDRTGLSALVAALGNGFMEKHFALICDPIVFRDCRIVQTTGGTGGGGAVIDFMDAGP